MAFALISRDMTEIHTGMPANELELLKAKVTPAERFAWVSCTLNHRELHAVYASLNNAVVGFPTEEAFHTWTGFYRDDAVGLGRSMTRPVHDSD
ncbi:hypothetical protein IHE55_17510 [Streptomyces pactum]|uniref:Uncharacterized protein n=1 Tax=Streptomyces pactum TaxID=68249 RepID=A0ABS0NMN7_9ACTN|nr:hypothetical protein [Streptomyces pactum]MBH5336475.1 hypothetical protein [Streptomyces pactum]